MPVLPEHSKGTAEKAERPRRRLFLYLVALLGLSWVAYGLLGRSFTMDADDKAIEQYGLNARPETNEMVQIMDLPPKYVPEIGKHRNPGRLVIVGDVHGMKDSLEELLEKVEFEEKHDHLILAGDIISKGPDSSGVVDLAMKLGATAVRGNHEDRIIHAYEEMIAGHVDMAATGSNEQLDDAQDTLEGQSLSHVSEKDRKLVKELGKKRMKWVKQCPVILRVGLLGDMGEVVVVHAGLAPGVKLEKQDANMVMNMRTIRNGVPSDDGEGRGWMKVSSLQFANQTRSGSN